MGGGDANDVSIDGRASGGLPAFEIGIDLISCVRGDAEAGGSFAVAERLLDCCEFPESIEDRLGDFLCGGPKLVRRGSSI